jgi:tetratricopeptide (TPR) repeat protein
LDEGQAVHAVICRQPSSPGPRAAGRLPLFLAGLVLLGLAACARPSAPATPGTPAASAAAQPLEQARRLLAAQGDPETALVLLDKDPGREARLLRLEALRRLDRLDEAVAGANRLILEEPGRADAFVDRAITLALMGRLERALEDCGAALTRDPKNRTALLTQGDIFFMQELPALAEASYSLAVAAAPMYPLARINRAVARDELGRFDDAIADFSRAIELDPASATAWAGRGVSRSQAGDMAGMCADYLRACELGLCRRLDDARAVGYCAP